MSKGGFDVKVQSQGAIPASYYCPHCKKLLKNAVQTSEGDRLCHVCFEEIARMPQHTCKECTLVVDPNECYPDMANRKEISRVMVLCDNEDLGCPWRGKLLELKDHVDKCQYKKTRCNLCFNYVLLSYLDQHKKEECFERELNCDYCNAGVIAKDSKTHFGCCQLFPVKCQHCQATVPRKNLPEHEENKCTHVLCVCGEAVKRENRGDPARKSGKPLMEDGPLVREAQAMQESMKTTTSHLDDVERNVSDIYKRLAQVEGDVLYLKAGSSFFPVEGGRELKLANSSIKELRAELRNMMNLVAALTNRVAQLEEQGHSKNYGMGEGSSREMAKSGLSVNDRLKFLEDKILEVEKKTTNMLISSVNGYPQCYYCPHCNNLLREAVQTKSGDRLCDSCFRSIARMPGRTCLVCHLTVNPKEFFPDKVIRLEISQLVILCQNHDLGCLWNGELKELFAHLHYCEYTNKIKCKLCLECVDVSYLNQHEKEECPERETGCDHCGTQVIAKDLKAHYGGCVLFPVPCVNCQKMVLRINLRKHEFECTHTQNKDLRHLNTLLVGLVIRWLMSLENKFKRLEEKTLQVEDATNSLGSYLGKLELEFLASLTSTYNGIYIWKIPDVRRKYREAKLGQNISICSSPFYTSKTGYKMCVRCYLNGDGLGEGQYLSLFFVIMKGEYDALLLWPFDGKVTLMLVDQEDCEKHIVHTVKPDPSSSNFSRPKTDMNVASGCPKFAPLKDVLENPSYVKDDTMYIKCLVDTEHMRHP